MISKIAQPLQVNSTLSTLLDELGEECEQVLSLLSQLKLSNLTADQKGNILAELTGSICHLHVHTENLPELVEDEILTLPDDD
jgi:septation ring formation regulator EzrA